MSTMVDSMPTSAAPPSRTQSTVAPNSQRTCSAVVADTRPKRFAEGAATPAPKRASKARARGWDGDEVDHARRALQDERQRPRPEPAREFVCLFRDFARPRGELRGLGDMNDQGMIVRAALDREHFPDRYGIGGVRAEAVDGLGRKRDQPPGPQHCDRLFDFTIGNHFIA